MAIKGAEEKRATVVIPLKNESRELEELLTALAQQLGRTDEVICIDTGSTDGTWEILCNFVQSHPQFKVFREEGAYPGRARNLAIGHTTARFIAQIDGGNWPCENWLPNLLNPLIADQADFVMGDVGVKPIIKALWGRRIDVGRFYGASLFRGRHIRGRSLHPPAGGACVAYERQAWETAGGFPEWLRVGEDQLFAQKLDRQNLRIVFAKNAKILWEIGPTLFDFLKRHLHFQCVKAGLESESHSPWKGFIIQGGFVAAVAVAALHPALWSLPGLIFFSAVSHQTLKSVRTYVLRHGEDQKDSGLWMITQFLFIESLVFPAKLLGSIKARLQPQKERQARQRQREKYLAP